MASALIDLAAIAISHSDWERASDLLEERFALSRAIDYPSGVCLSLFNLGYLALIEADPVRSERLLREAVAVSRLREDWWTAAQGLQNLGFALLLQGRTDEAGKVLTEAIRPLAALGANRIGAYCCYGLAAIAADRGAYLRAARLGAGDHLLGEVVAALEIAEQRVREDALRTLEATLDSDRLVRALADGASYDLGEAASYAVDGER